MKKIVKAPSLKIKTTMEKATPKGSRRKGKMYPNTKHMKQRQPTEKVPREVPFAPYAPNTDALKLPSILTKLTKDNETIRKGKYADPSGVVSTSNMLLLLSTRTRQVRAIPPRNPMTRSVC